MVGQILDTNTQLFWRALQSNVHFEKNRYDDATLNTKYSSYSEEHFGRSPFNTAAVFYMPLSIKDQNKKEFSEQDSE